MSDSITIVKSNDEIEVFRLNINRLCTLAQEKNSLAHLLVHRLSSTLDRSLAESQQVLSITLEIATGGMEAYQS